MCNIAPNNLHFIWVGCHVPKHLLQNFMEWVELNPGYTVRLWTESSLLAMHRDSVVEELQGGVVEGKYSDYSVSDEFGDIVITILRGFMEPLTLTISAFNQLELLIDPCFIYEELSAWKNYGAASDLLRYSILYALGGVYLDFDIYPDYGGLPLNIIMPKGILFCLRKLVRGTAIGNSVMAAPKGSSKLKEMAELVHTNYAADYLEITKGVYYISDEEQEKKRALEDVRSQTALIPEGEEMPDELYDQLEDILVTHTKTRTGPTLVADFLEQYEKLALNDPEIFLYDFREQTGYKLSVDSEMSWVK